MSDPRPDIDDELVSAVLDGEATAEERALVEASPEGRRRLEELRAASAHVAEPVEPLPAAAIDALVAAAMDSAAPRPETAPASLDDRRRRRNRSWGQMVATAAAVVVVLAGVVAGVRAIGSSSSDSSSDTSSAASSSDRGAATADQGGDAASAESGAAAGPESANGRTPSTFPLVLGAQPDAAEAVNATRLALGGPVGVQQFDLGSAPALSACPLPSAVAPTEGPWRVVAVTSLPGGPVTVIAEGPDLAGARLVVVDDATCSVLLDQTP